MAETPNINPGLIDSGRGLVTKTAEGLDSPENIVLTIQIARATYENYRAQNLDRIALNSVIEGIISGNPPYDQAELEANGLGHIANFNPLDARSLFDRTALGYWNLMTGTEYLCKFTFNGPWAKDPKALEYAEIMARHWTDVVRMWPSFYVANNVNIAQLVKFGYSGVIWPDELDWRWKPVEVSRLYFPDQAQTDIQYLTTFCLDTPFTMQYLMQVYKKLPKTDAELKAASGEYTEGKKGHSFWKKEALEQVILSYANSQLKPENQIDMMTLQKRFQEGDSSFASLFTDTIRLVSLFQQEYDGKVSHYIFDRLAGQDFLYCGKNLYGSLNDVFNLFTTSPGESTIHSNRGIGHKLLSICQAMMMLDCSIVDAARWSSSPIINSPSTGTSSVEKIKFTPGAPINIGMNQLQQNRIGDSIDQLVGASQYLLSKANFNSANAGDDPGIPDRHAQGSISAQQSKTRAFEKSGLLKQSIQHFYSQYDNLVKNMVVKMLKSKSGYPGYEYAKEWKTRCVEDGVPPELFDVGTLNYWGLPRHLNVGAARTAGDGSALGIMMSLEALAPFVPTMGPREAEAYKRLAIIAGPGADYIPTFLQESSKADETAGGASLAALENNAIQEGKPVIFSPDNDQASHIISHIQFLSSVIQAITQQQMTPIDADPIFRSGIPHLGAHLEFYSRSPFARQFIEGVKEPWNQIRDYAALNAKNAQKMYAAELKKRQQAEEAQAKVMSDAEREDFKAQKDEARKDFKIQSQVQRAAEANQTRAEVQKEKIYLDAANQKDKNKLDAAVKRESEISKLSTEVILGRMEQMRGNTPSPTDIE
jgi:hypothetical protein